MMKHARHLLFPLLGVFGFLLFSIAHTFAQAPPSSVNAQYNKAKNVWAGDNFEQVCTITPTGSPGTFTPICPSNNITITASGQTIALPVVGTPPGYQPGGVTKSVELNIFYSAAYVPNFAAGYSWSNGAAPVQCTAGASGCLAGAISANPDLIECRTASETVVRCGAPLTAMSSTCAQAGIVLARTSGENTGALGNLVCGLVSNGLIDSTASMASTGSNPYCGSGSVFDRLGVMAMANAGDALLDLCGHTSAVTHGSPAFAANNGYTGGSDNNSTVYIDTGFNAPSAAGHYTQNNAHFGTWTLTNLQSASSNGVSMGVFDGTNTSYLSYWYATGPTQSKINGNNAITYSSTGAHGDWVVVRSAASAAAVYKNAASLASVTTASAGLISANFALLGEFNTTTSASDSGDANQMSIWHIGSAMTPTQLSNFHTLVCNYLTAVSGGC